MLEDFRKNKCNVLISVTLAQKDLLIFTINLFYICQFPQKKITTCIVTKITITIFNIKKNPLTDNKQTIQKISQ